jgi:hypothetical protein
MTGAEIGEALDLALSTVSGIPMRIGVGKLGRIGLEPARRYERARPGELIHVDVKKLGRIGRPGRSPGARITPSSAKSPIGPLRAGLGVRTRAIDDATRLAHVEVVADERAVTAVGFLRRAVAQSRQRRHQDRTPDHRRRKRLQIHRPRDRVPHPRHPPPPNSAMPTPDQAARPSSSSTPSLAFRHTARSTATAPNATPLSPAGLTSTIAAYPMAPSATSGPSLATRADQPPRVLQLERERG